MYNLQTSFFFIVGAVLNMNCRGWKRMTGNSHGSQPGLHERTFSTRPPPPSSSLLLPPSPPQQQQLWDWEGLSSCSPRGEERGRMGMLERWEWSFMAWNWPHCILQTENMTPDSYKAYSPSVAVWTHWCRCSQIKAERHNPYLPFHPYIFIYDSSGLFSFSCCPLGWFSVHILMSPGV